MRTPLTILAAIGLVASTAAAANFDINAADETLDNVSTATSDADSCTSGIELDLLHSNYDADQDDWKVTGVRITHPDVDIDRLTETCLDRALRVAIDTVPTDADPGNLLQIGPFVLNVDTVIDGILDLPLNENIRPWVADVTDVTVQLDTDGDILAAAQALRDLDGDGISDADELARGLDPNSADSDRDGVRDDIDAFPLDNSESVDTDDDGVGNNTDDDDDNDGHTDDDETTAGSDPLDPASTPKNGDVCTAADCYAAIHGNWTWETARADAERRGGSLAKISSASDNAVLASFNVDGFIGALRARDANNRWTDDWIWLDGSPLEYTSWNWGEPNNSGGEPYAHMWAPDGLWNDLQSSSQRSYYYLECAGPVVNERCGS